MRLFSFLFIIFSITSVYANAHIKFTQEEKEYLHKKDVIRYCTQPDALPYSAIKDSHFIGIGANILEKASEYSHIKFKLIQTKTWSESVHKAILKECDILPLATSTPSRLKYFNFTYSYYNEPLVLVIKKETDYIRNIQNVLDKNFSVVKGTSYIELLKKKYPNIKLIVVDNIKEGLSGVKNGKYYAHIDILMDSAYAIQTLPDLNLKISNSLNTNINVCCAVRKDDRILFSILNKVAQSLRVKDIQTILNKWITINNVQKHDYSYLKWLIVIVFMIVFFSLYREYFLKKKNRELEILQDKLVDLNQTLESRITAATYDLEQAQEVAKIGFWVYDIVKEKLKWSKYTYTMLEVVPTVGENLYNEFFKKIHPEDMEDVKNAYESSLKNKTIYSIEHRIVMEDGGIKYVSERGETRYAKDGTPLITYGTTRDITEKIVTEQELKKKDAFLLHQSRLAQMGEMLSMIAHQWKQPLSSIATTQILIKTTLELSKYDLSQEQGRNDFLVFLNERLDRISLYVQNLSNTIKDFSDFYKPNKLAKKNSVDVLILKACELIKDSVSSNNIGLSFDLNAKDMLQLYENEFMQVILNIIQNAKDQLLEKKIDGAKIEVRSYAEQEYVFVEIEDNAGGIKEEHIDKIFDPYFSTKLEKNGTGLGLYMCRMIIGEYHHGDIRVENATHGALFTIKIKKLSEDEL